MADINEEFSAAMAKAQAELDQFGVVSNETAARLKVAGAAVDKFEKKMAAATNAASALYQTFTSYNKAVTQGVKGYNDLAATTDNLATTFEAVGAALSLFLPFGRAAKIAIAGLGLLAGELTRSSKAIGEQLDGLRSGFDDLSQIGATTARGLTDMFEVMQQAGLSVKDFPAFAKQLAEQGEILAQFGGTVNTGRTAVLNLADDLKPMRGELMNFGIRIEQIGEASLGFVKNQRMFTLGSKANMDLSARSMMEYVKELDTLTRLTGVSRKEQEKNMEKAMRHDAFAATLDDMQLQGRKKEADVLLKNLAFYSRLGPKAEAAYMDSVSGFVGTTEDAGQLFMSTYGSIQEQIAGIKDGVIGIGDLAESNQRVYGSMKDFADTLGRGAAMLGVQVGLPYTELKKAIDAGSGDIKAALEEVAKDQNKTDEILKKQNTLLIRTNDEMLNNQRTLMSLTSAYQSSIGGVTGVLGGFSTALNNATQAVSNFISGKKSGGGGGSATSSLGSAAGGGSTSAAAATSSMAAAGSPAQTSMSAPPPGAVPPTPTQAPQLSAIREMIAKAESQGNYNVLVGGKTANLTEMTIAEVMQLQRGLIGQGKGSAAGKYQVIYKTLAEVVGKMGLDYNQKFDATTQDSIADFLIMRRGFNQYAKSGTPEAKQRFLSNLAAEWAGLPAGPDNKSRYAGVGNNAAHITWNDALQMFADGGNLRGVGIVGERGPELAVGSGSITSNTDIMGAFRDMIALLERNQMALADIASNSKSTVDISDRMLRIAQN